MKPLTVHTVTHSEGGRVTCTCGWSTPAPVFSTANAKRFATTHLHNSKGRNG